MAGKKAKKAEITPEPAPQQAPAPKAEAKPAEAKKMDDNTLALISYILLWLTGIIVFLIAKDQAKDQKYVKFHAMQAIILGVVQFVLCIVLIGFLLAPFIWLYALYIGFVYAYKGQKYKIPYIGDYAEKYAEDTK